MRTSILVGPIAGLVLLSAGFASATGREYSGTAFPGAAALPFSVNVTESGLAPGTEWVFEVGGHSWSTNASWLLIQEPNGTYNYSAFLQGSSSPSSNGSFKISGASISLPLRFGAAAGLPSTTHASASASPSSYASLGSIALIALVLAAVVGLGARRILRRPPPESKPALADPPVGEPPVAEPEDPLGHLV